MKDATQHQRTPWGVLPETLAVISKLARGEITAEEFAEERPESQAALRSGRMTGGVAVLNLCGLITPKPSFLSMLFGGGGGLISFRESFREALSNDDISAILINVDSPGGRVDLVPETAAEIRAARGTKPIVAISNTMAASAAYWIASQADELVVTPSGQVGSIGVFVVHDDFSGMNELMGIKPTYISAGKYKTDGNPDEPLSESARADFQQQVDDLYAMFVADVAKGRGTTVSAVKSGYGEGRMMIAKRAITAGMVDRVDTFEGTVAKMVGGRRRGGASASEQLDELKAAIAAGLVTADQAREALNLTPAAAEADPASAEETDPPADIVDEVESEETDTTDTETGGDNASSSVEDRRRMADLLFG